MSPRKPAGENYESWVDRQIREARERGEFDNLPGAGKPLPDLHRPYDELWWVRKKLKEENLSYLPPALQLRKEVEEAREQITRARSEREVRKIVAGINERIREANRTSLQGPASTVMPLDEEQKVRTWRERRASDDR
ncbi:MAG: DUF1992 domain-containing protein [Actinomycetota bacterium]|nr:DUF1992 domain-containing protein [Actinomycetota bacterium]